jgi:hypothetical protein
MCHKCKSIVEKLLEKEQKNYDTREKMIAWRLGYLIGMLHTMIHDDAALRVKLLQKIKQ